MPLENAKTISSIIFIHISKAKSNEVNCIKGEYWTLYDVGYNIHVLYIYNKDTIQYCQYISGFTFRIFYSDIVDHELRVLEAVGCSAISSNWTTFVRDSQYLSDNKDNRYDFNPSFMANYLVQSERKKNFGVWRTRGCCVHFSYMFHLTPDKRWSLAFTISENFSFFTNLFVIIRIIIGHLKIG